MQEINPKHLTAAQFRRLADIKDQIVALENEFSTIVTTGTPVSMPKDVNRGWSAERRRNFNHAITTRREMAKVQPRRKMSAEARAKISAAAKRRWKKVWAKGGKHL